MNDSPLLAISLCEPYASAIYLGLKQNETRGWPTRYRGDLVICAAKRKMDPGTANSALTLGIFNQGHQPQYGLALCVVEVYDCLSTDAANLRLDDMERSLGDYRRRRFAWLTRNLRQLKTPIPVIGHQQLFKLPPEQEAAIRKQLS